MGPGYSNLRKIVEKPKKIILIIEKGFALFCFFNFLCDLDELDETLLIHLQMPLYWSLLPVGEWLFLIDVGSIGNLPIADATGPNTARNYLTNDIYAKVLPGVRIVKGDEEERKRVGKRLKDDKFDVIKYFLNR